MAELLIKCYEHVKTFRNQVRRGRAGGRALYRGVGEMPQTAVTIKNDRVILKWKIDYTKITNRNTYTVTTEPRRMTDDDDDDVQHPDEDERIR
ncbi:unnamed protein product [Danaus chrysippus]|uniref:(African queen) hypothetical protein n=1 Tax=Danaus chrysippus TaxID=151541 RepID=A0A8J2R5S8_9NEOP|nr:unnamed protein product [Danaus chrysippus]